MLKQLLAALSATLVSGLILASSAFAAAPANTTPPNVSGTAKVGSTLTVSNGTWSNSPTSYTYQWQRCSSATSCTDIANALGQSYVVRNADGGFQDPRRRDGDQRRRSGDGSFEHDVDRRRERRTGQHRSSVRHG